MADISIPGVSDKYKTSDYIEALMKKEKIPLTHEQESLDRYKEQQSAWRGMNQKMSSLRESTKTLYSFENPFNNKLASSSEERAITAEAGREASYESFKIDVLQEAKADRFLSAELDKNSTVPKGKYTFQVADKTITFNWKGGKLTDFINSLNKRSTNSLKASLVGVNNSKSSLLIESLKTGLDSRLVFKDDALKFALDNKLVEKNRKDVTEIGSSVSDLENPPEELKFPEIEQKGMPAMTTEQISSDEETGRTIVPPRSGFAIKIGDEFKGIQTERLEFTYSLQEVEDITEELNIKRTTRPELPDAGEATFETITILNEQSETNLPPVPLEPLVPITGGEEFFVHNADGTEVKITTKDFAIDGNGNRTVSLALKEYPEIESLVVRNRNTGAQIAVSPLSLYDEKKNLGYTAVNPISEAGDAVIKYEGITITRPSNKIDDVVPHVTLNVHQPTEKTATIDIEPDKDSAKNALIEFVGRYNQVISEINILSDNKPEIVAELDYLSKEEQDAANERLGMFQGDFSLTNGKSSIRSIATASYRWSDTATITMLNQIGISSRATGNSGGSYNAAQMRGYLEIDEKKLDSVLGENLDEIKNLFGYDSDGDLIIDSGIGYALDKQLSSWVQSGGIIANKNRTLDSRIKQSETTIRKLETQIASKEMQLRSKYGQMEGTLNSLNAQSNSISNFANSGKQ
ncbi:MAG: flagellar filament capping protein FliD [Treponema sp.]|nr:flagellar filament capping protein FliD [Candidatus Treponema equifaecale]